MDPAVAASAAAAGDVVSDVRDDGRKLKQREADALTSVTADAVLSLQCSVLVHCAEHYCRALVKLSLVHFTVRLIRYRCAPTDNDYSFIHSFISLTHYAEAARKQHARIYMYTEISMLWPKSLSKKSSQRTFLTCGR